MHTHKYLVKRENSYIVEQNNLLKKEKKRLLRETKRLQLELELLKEYKKNIMEMNI